MVHTWRQCRIRMERNLYWFIEGQACFSTSTCQMSLTLNEPLNIGFICTNIDAHYLQVCTKNLPKHGRCCMQNNQLSIKSYYESEDNPNVSHNLLLLKWKEACQHQNCEVQFISSWRCGSWFLGQILMSRAIPALFAHHALVDGLFGILKRRLCQGPCALDDGPNSFQSSQMFGFMLSRPVVPVHMIYNILGHLLIVGSTHYLQRLAVLEVSNGDHVTTDVPSPFHRFQTVY